MRKSAEKMRLKSIKKSKCNPGLKSSNQLLWSIPEIVIFPVSPSGHQLIAIWQQQAIKKVLCTPMSVGG